MYPTIDVGVEIKANLDDYNDAVSDEDLDNGCDSNDGDHDSHAD